MVATILATTPTTVIITLFLKDRSMGVPFRRSLKDSLLISTGHTLTIPELMAWELLKEREMI
jgi:hypothetical protein